MRISPFIMAAVLLSAAVSSVNAGDVVHYLACRADNEDQQSIVAIDETTKKICDREFSSAWMAPMAFDKSLIEWGNGSSDRKSIATSRKGSRYEHDTYFVVVHIGHCNKIKAPPTPLCSG